MRSAEKKLSKRAIQICSKNPMILSRKKCGANYWTQTSDEFVHNLFEPPLHSLSLFLVASHNQAKLQNRHRLFKQQAFGPHRSMMWGDNPLRCIGWKVYKVWMQSNKPRYLQNGPGAADNFAAKSQTKSFVGPATRRKWNEIVKKNHVKNINKKSWSNS